MPYGMPNILMQGPVLHAMDKLLNKDRKHPSQFEARLKVHQANLTSTLTRIPDLMVSGGVIKPGSESDVHLRKHWFPNPALPLPSTAWWPGLQLIEPVTKRGYANAIQVNLDRIAAGKKPLRFDSYWACIPDWDDTDPEYYQIGYTVTNRQITIITFTPPEPGHTYIPVSQLTPEPVYFTKRPGDERPGLKELDIWIEEDGAPIGLYQVLRLHDKANTKPLKPAAMKRAKERAKQRAKTKRSARRRR